MWSKKFEWYVKGHETRARQRWRHIQREPLLLGSMGGIQMVGEYRNTHAEVSPVLLAFQGTKTVKVLYRKIFSKVVDDPGMTPPPWELDVLLTVLGRERNIKVTQITHGIPPQSDSKGLKTDSNMTQMWDPESLLSQFCATLRSVCCMAVSLL